jgi:hypothetical protein
MNYFNTTTSRHAQSDKLNGKLKVNQPHLDNLNQVLCFYAKRDLPIQGRLSLCAFQEWQYPSFTRRWITLRA